MNFYLTVAFLYIIQKIFPSLKALVFKTADNGKSLLWEISGNGLPRPSWFYGTMHLMCAEDAVVNSNLKMIIGEVERIYLEVNMDNAGELIGGMVDFNMKNNGHLKDHLNEEEYNLVRLFFEKHMPGLPFEALERQHPLMLSGSLYELFLPCEHKNGMELKIVNEAFCQKKEITWVGNA